MDSLKSERILNNISRLSSENIEIFVDYLELYKYVLMQSTLKHCTDLNWMMFASWQFKAYEELIKNLKSNIKWGNFHNKINGKVENVQ